MKCVKRNVSVPYGGVWKFRHRMLDIPIEAPDLHSLFDLATQIHKANNLPLGLDIRNLWTQWLCEDMPDECVDCGGQKILLNAGDVLRGTKVVLEHLKDGTLVSSEEAERRAAICASCMNNVAIAVNVGFGCCSAKRAGNAIRAVLQVPQTSQNAKLRSCKICHCFLSVAVYMPMEVQCEEVTPLMKQHFAKVPKCWKQC